MIMQKKINKGSKKTHGRLIREWSVDDGKFAFFNGLIRSK